eukprot:gene8999-2959_t
MGGEKNRVAGLVSQAVRSRPDDIAPEVLEELTHFVRRGLGKDILASCKAPLKNHDNPQTQINALTVLDSLIQTSEAQLLWTFGTDKWMSRLLEIANRTENRNVRDTITACIIAWSKVYQVYGPINTAANKIQQGKEPRLELPTDQAVTR